ncbi:MAG: methylated-DNA--[protein]-cysteine S-methyltransferase [Isosphaeraceae bacterium]
MSIVGGGVGDDPAPALERLHNDWPGALVQYGRELEPTARRVVAHVVEADPCADIPLDLRGTPFQLRVWAALREIPHGTTVGYGELARRVGLPTGAARAVGTACGANPVALIVPGHRVVRAGGNLGGFYWGLECKRRLLDIEQAAGRAVVSQPVVESLTAVP